MGSVYTSLERPAVQGKSSVMKNVKSLAESPFSEGLAATGGMALAAENASLHAADC